MSILVSTWSERHWMLIDSRQRPTPFCYFSLLSSPTPFSLLPSPILCVCVGLARWVGPRFVRHRRPSRSVSRPSPQAPSSTSSGSGKCLEMTFRYSLMIMDIIIRHRKLSTFRPLIDCVSTESTTHTREEVMCIWQTTIQMGPTSVHSAWICRCVSDERPYRLTLFLCVSVGVCLHLRSVSCCVVRSTVILTLRLCLWVCCGVLKRSQFRGLWEQSTTFDEASRDEVC